MLWRRPLNEYASSSMQGPPTTQAAWVHQIHAAGGASGSYTMVMCLSCCLCFLCSFWLVTTHQSYLRYVHFRGVTQWATQACTIPFATCSLWTLLFGQDLAFIAPLFFFIRKISDENTFCLSSSSGRSFACFGYKTLYLLNWFSSLVTADSPCLPNCLISASNCYCPALGLYFFFFFFLTIPSFSS